MPSSNLEIEPSASIPGDQITCGERTAAVLLVEGTPKKQVEQSDLDLKLDLNESPWQKVELYQTNLHQFYLLGMDDETFGKSMGHWRKEWEAVSVGSKPDRAFGRN